jgi:hypothetical protein
MIALLTWLTLLLVGIAFIERSDVVWRLLFWFEVRRLERESKDVG